MTIMTMMSDEVKKAGEVLRKGGLLLYPTDTVWGVGCDACCEEAVRKIFALKKRSDSKSLVLLASSLEQISRYIEDIPPMAEQLIEVNDAPMTIVYPGAMKGEGPHAGEFIAPSCIAADGSVGIRIPSASGFCMALLESFGRPIVSTSANISGEKAPDSFSEIVSAIKDGVDFVVNPSFEAGSTGRCSQIIKLGADGTINIIRA